MDERFKKQLLLSIIDKILFGIIILIISYVLNFYVETKINEIDRREQDRYKAAEQVKQNRYKEAERDRRNRDLEAQRLRQILQSVSKINSDLVVEQRKGLTKSMGNFFMEVSSHAPTGKITAKDFEDLNKITKNIKISIYQIDGLSPKFSERPKVDSFLKTLLDCNIYLGTHKRLTKKKIEAKLKEVRGAYTHLLEELRQVSIDLAQIDYEGVKP